MKEAVEAATKKSMEEVMKWMGNKNNPGNPGNPEVQKVSRGCSARTLRVDTEDKCVGTVWRLYGGNSTRTVYGELYF